MINLALVSAGIVAAAGSVLLVLMLLGLAVLAVCRVPYAGTPPNQIERILNAIELSPGQRFHDLGCGDGRVVFAAARRGAIATGYELQPIPYLRAQWRRWRRYPQARIRFGNFRRATVADADVVFCFLVASVMPSLAAWLAQRLRPTAIVVSYGFPLPRWQPTTILKSTKPNGSNVYIYQKIPPHESKEKN